MASETTLFSLQREKVTDKSTGLRQPELLTEWQEQYTIEETEPFPLDKQPKLPWYKRGQYK